MCYRNLTDFPVNINELCYVRSLSSGIPSCRSSSVNTLFLLHGVTQPWLCIGWLRSFTCKTVVFRCAHFSSTWTVNFVKLTVGV